MKNLTEAQLKKTFATRLLKKNVGMFMHCKNCVKELLEGGLPKGKSVSESTSYEGTAYPFTYPDKSKATIFVMWCKKCGKVVWDSRHLQQWL